MEKVVRGDQIDSKRAQILLKYNSNRYHKLTVDEQIDCIIDQATDVDILDRSWAGLETFIFIIDTSSDQIIGIDFGSGFNAATILLPVPELIPIRLTRQVTQLMSHIGRAGLFRATMIHRMNVLHQNSDLLVSTMDEHALKTKINILRSDDIYAKDRIKSTRFKLNGINPTLIIGFLRSSNLKEARHQMEKVVRGDKIDSKRAQILLKYNSNRYHKLTVDE
ncbi:unnamed protein product [Rotaria sordida]|uniref:PI3K/PI4K catalytic domain-containing protein n=2 Tax=Rotaria sordida TaxID=392033 RepID=A0A815Q2Y5_9BILA|nr:unnamed protein product [Rotaria sordida]